MERNAKELIMKKYALVEVTDTNEIPLNSYSKVKKLGGKSIKELTDILAKALYEDYWDDPNDWKWETEPDENIKKDYIDKSKVVINALKKLWKI